MLRFMDIFQVESSYSRVTPNGEIMSYIRLRMWLVDQKSSNFWVIKALKNMEGADRWDTAEIQKSKIREKLWKRLVECGV